jgi:hypothetical protein
VIGIQTALVFERMEMLQARVEPSVV